MYGDGGTLKKRWHDLGLGPENIIFDSGAFEATLC